MNSIPAIALLATLLIGCSRNAPGTMGGGGYGIPETVATGAPKLWAESTPSTDSHQPALLLEHSASSFEAEANAATLTLPKALQLRSRLLTEQSPRGKLKQRQRKQQLINYYVSNYHCVGLKFYSTCAFATRASCGARNGRAHLAGDLHGRGEIVALPGNSSGLKRGRIKRNWSEGSSN